MNERELTVLEHLRRDARKHFTQIDRETEIPTTTVFDYYRKFKGNVIKREVALLDFKKLGYEEDAFFLVKTDNNALINYLEKDSNINNLHKISEEEFFLEAYFRDENDAERFLKTLKSFDAEVRLWTSQEEIKRECFFPTKTFI